MRNMGAEGEETARMASLILELRYYEIYDMSQTGRNFLQNVVEKVSQNL